MELSNKIWDLVIVGGGAAGYFCAANVIEKHPDKNILIVEASNKVLSKVRVSGGGRCNVTHACFDPAELAQNYPRGKKELRGPFTRFACGDTMEWFQSRGVELKIEDDGRVFPTTDSSETIIKTLEKYSTGKGVELSVQTAVSNIIKEENAYILKSSKGNIQAKNIFWSTGGKESALKILDAFGVALKDRYPSLFSFNIPDKRLTDLAGLSFQKISVGIEGFKYHSAGPSVITHWGLSGPAVLKMSAFAAQFLHGKSYHFTTKISWVDMDFESMTDYLKDLQLSKPAQKLSNRIFEELPKRFWKYILDKSEVNPEKSFRELSKQEIESLADKLTQQKLQVKGKTTFKEEFVTGGGIDLKAINFKTMELKDFPGFYVGGEVCDIDGVTGGFNFQNAWTSAFIAAESFKL